MNSTSKICQLDIFEQISHISVPIVYQNIARLDICSAFVKMAQECQAWSHTCMNKPLSMQNSQSIQDSNLWLYKPLGIRCMQDIIIQMS